VPAYAYSGVNDRGKAVKGVASADTIASLKASLKREGVYLTAVSETSAIATEGAGSGSGIDVSRFFDRVGQKEVAQITRLLGTLLGAGVTLPESLVALTDQVESPRLKGILADIAQRVNEGASLADSMGKYPKVFPPLYVNMIRAGEASGALETVLLRLAEFLERSMELRGKVTSAMLYPVILSFLGAVIIAVLMIFIVPKITAMFDEMNAELPWNTKLLIFSSDMLATYWYLALAMIAAGVWFFRRWRQTAVGRLTIDTFLLRGPIVGDLVRKVAIARFTRTLATLLQSGVQLLQAMEIVEALLENVVLERVVRDARDNIREGEGIAPALKRSREFPPLVTHMIAVGERSGQLEQMLNEIAQTYERETSTAIERMTTLLEPLMIVAMGISVGFVMFSIMQPIMKLNELAGT
jgi:general secretion pathway protein F